MVEHLAEDILECYVLNMLSEVEAEVVEDHISLCAVCLDELDSVTGFSKAILTALQTAGQGISQVNAGAAG